MKTWKQKELKENEKIIDEKLYESSEVEDEWVKVKELGIEVQKELAVKEVKFKDDCVPLEGCRLLTLKEAIDIVNDKKLAKELNFCQDVGFFEVLEQAFEDNRKDYPFIVLYRNGDRYLYAGDGVLSYSGSYGRVRFCRKLVEEKE